MMMMKMTTHDHRTESNQHKQEEDQKQQRQEKQQKHNKKVSFNRKAKAKKILHINNYTNEERDACWYSEEEKLALKNEFNEIAQQMMMDKNLQHIETRGLEIYKSEEQYILKQRDRQISRMSVLETQTLYKKEQCDTKMIAKLSKIYFRRTTQSKKDAYLLAIQYQSEEQHSRREQEEEKEHEEEEQQQEQGPQAKVALTATSTRTTPTTAAYRINDKPLQLCSMAA